MITTLRRVALVVAGLALLGIGLRPTHRVAISVTEAVLVTPGADPTGGAVGHLVDSLHAPLYAGAAELRRARPAIRRLHVVGWGLEAEEWRDLDSVPLVGHPTALPPGIRAVSWPAVVVLGDRLIVEGEIAVGRERQITLRDPAGLVVDSAPIGPADGDGAFQLAAVPRAVGQHRYTLQGETLGVTVLPPPAWRVLVLEATPSFETSALRDWLARGGGTTGSGGSVALRTLVSRDRVRTEFVNMKRVALTPVTSRLLDQFDVVVVDGRTLVELTGTERGALRGAVERGLGVLIVPDTALFDPSRRFPDRDFFFGFTPVRIPDLDLRLVRPSWPAARDLTVSVPAAPYHLAPRFGVAMTMVDGSGATLAQVAPRGAGRVGVSLVTGAARWRRAGEEAAFAGYWSRLLAALATGSRSTPHWSIESPGPWFVDRPVTIAVTASQAIPVAIVTGPGATRDSVFLAPDPLEPARQRGVFWPREPGWYAVADEGGAGFYAQSAGTWTGRQAALRRAATARHAVAVESGTARFPSGGSQAMRETRRPISPLWFFAAFLLAAGVLWSARRPLRSGQPRGGMPIR